MDRPKRKEVLQMIGGPMVGIPETTEQEICLKCQACCRHLTFIVGNAALEELGSFYTTRGVIQKQNPFEPNRSTALIVPSPCQHIRKGTGCRIYHIRPEYCKNYDGRQDPIFKDLCELPK